MKTSLVSIIITTKNEEIHLSSLLESIAKQTYKTIETIVVDNNSTDKTKVIAKTFGAQVFDKGPERSAQRNFGAEKARGEYLLFLDADMSVSPPVVEECVRVIQKEEIKAVVIPEKSVGVGFWAKCKALERSFYEGVAWMEAARFYKKDVFLKIGGYDTNLTGPEDFELPQRLLSAYGVNAVGRILSYIYHDEGRVSLVKLLRKKYYYGKKMGRYRSIKTSKGYFNKQANLLARYILFFRKPFRLLRDPAHALGMFIMKTLEMMVLVCGGIRS